MSCFLSKLEMENLDGKDDGEWKLIAPLVYSSSVAGWIFKVPAGFVTDLASIPRLPLVYWLMGGKANESSVVHDWLYSSKQVSRYMADCVLVEASAVIGVSWWRRVLLFAGVRLFGASHYGKN